MEISIEAVGVILDVIVIIIVLREINHLGQHQDVVKLSVDAIGESVRLLERDRIYFYLSQTAREAKKYVHHLSISNSPIEIDDLDERKRVTDFLLALDEARGRNIDVHLLGPDLSAKIGGLWERKQRLKDVKVSSEVTGFDLRIQIVDGYQVVIGVGPPEARSEHGFLIKSFRLANMLDREFRRLWDEAQDFDAYVNKVFARFVWPLYVPKEIAFSILENSLNVTSRIMSENLMRIILDNGEIIEIDEYLFNRGVLVEQLARLGDNKDNLKQYILSVCLDLTSEQLDHLINRV